MGGKGYKPRKDYAGRTVSGDWEDSDRGAGNKATRRSGGTVKAKSPTYLAHVHNKGKKKVDPKKNPVVEDAIDERYFSDNTRGVSTKGGLRSQYNKPGKLSQSSFSHERKSKNPELRMSKKELRKSMEGDANYEKKMGRSKPTPSNLKTALKKQNEEVVYEVAGTVKKKPGVGEKVGKVAGSVAGGVAGSAAVGGPTLGVGALAGGIAGSVAGEKVGGTIGKGVDKVRSKFKKESFSDWRDELNEAERKLSDRLARKRKLYDKTTSKAMDDARRTGEASGHNRYRMFSLDTEMDGIKARMKKKDVKEAKVDAGKSPEEKEKVRNVRKFGVSHNVAGHGKLRRSLHKMNRGDKKIPGDKSKWMEMESLQLGEEGYDRMRDARLVKYGIGHDGSDRKGSTSRPTGKQPKGKTVLQKETEKKYGKGVSALDVVKKQIQDKHGKGAIMDTKKK